MSTILTVLNHFFALDFGWLLQFVLDNILWFFLFAAAAAIFYEKRNWFWSFVYIVFYVWASIEFGALVGWQVVSHEFLARVGRID